MNQCSFYITHLKVFGEPYLNSSRFLYNPVALITTLKNIEGVGPQIHQIHWHKNYWEVLQKVDRESSRAREWAGQRAAPAAIWAETQGQR